MQHVERREPDRAAEIEALQGAVLIDEAAVATTTRIGTIKNVGAAGHRTYRQTTADDLAEGGQIRRHAEMLLRTAQPVAQAGDHFVHDEQHVVAAREFAQAVEKTRLRCEHALDRLDDHRSQLVRMRADDPRGGGQIVERRDDHQLLYLSGNAGAVRLRQIG